MPSVTPRSRDREASTEGASSPGPGLSSARPAAGPPTCNTGVGFEPEPHNGAESRACRAPSDGLYGWDWSATTHDGRQGVVDDLLQALGTAIALPGKGLQGWSQSVQAYDREGYLLGSVYFGGGREDVHVVSTSSAADQARQAVVGMDRARTSRVDTRVDTLMPYEDLVWVCESAAATYGSRITRMESSERGQSLGRTTYLGAPSSAVRVRVYEKWLESPGEYLEGTNRVEVQLRPASKVKERVSRWSPAETFCASKVTRDLAQRLGDDLAPKSTLHVARKTPDLERTLRTMGEQYGKAVDRWLSVSGGDLDRVLDHLLRTEEGPCPIATAAS